jgi:molybdate transport system permease protein
VALPLVLPPTVLGFYLLIGFGPMGPIGQMLINLGGQHLAFTFTGLVVASVIYSLPFMVQPLLHAFSSLGNRPLEVAATLRASPLDAFFTVVVPMSRRAFLTAIVLTFAHTIGEFGVVLMVGGNIPGATRVLSIAIFDHVEAMDYARAHVLAGGLLVSSFVMLLLLYTMNRQTRTVLP